MLHVEGPWFKDAHGRTLLLRGVNLGGSSKVPRTPDMPTYRRDGFFEHRELSFVGRPFPLEEADEHFGRLRGWGFTIVRLLVTWEAIEHGGPGIYDDEYLDYVVALVQKAGEYGLSILIDPHQDVWSRFSGGDGAPGWTFEAAGLDITHFAETGAAIVHAFHGDPLPKMIWPSNHDKLAAATMFTLFFGGNAFAPRLTVNGEPVQEYLQRHYIGAVARLAGRLRDAPNVVGYDTMNEPGRGYIGYHDLRAPETLLRVGAVPTPFQAMLLGAGYAQEVEHWEWAFLGTTRSLGTRTLNAENARAWLEGRDCVWREHGVWGADAGGTPQLLRPDYFRSVGGRPADFSQHFLRPFINRFAEGIRAADPRALMFIETEVTREPPVWQPGDAPGIVFSPHWYDVVVLFAKRFNPLIGVDVMSRRPVFGPRAIRAAYARQLANYQRQSHVRLGNAPVLIGEFGIPFDLDDKRAYRTGDFSAQVRALNRSFRALDDTLLSGTLWAYTADNTNERGDLWNDEDLSIFSRDQQHNPANPNSGGRALAAAARPYAYATAGEPLQMHFEPRTREFEFVFRHAPGIDAPTEIIMPRFQYPNGYSVAVSDGSYEIDTARQRLIYRHSDTLTVHTIRCALP